MNQVTGETSFDEDRRWTDFSEIEPGEPESDLGKAVTCMIWFHHRNITPIRPRNETP
jgi:hypothetical protein